MKDNSILSVLPAGIDKKSSDIRVLVVAENQHQRSAFSDTVRSCNFTLVDCVTLQQLRDKDSLDEYHVDIWLLDSDYDRQVLKDCGAAVSLVLIGFEQAPYLNEATQYGKWQRKLKRKLAYLLELPELLDRSNYQGSSAPWQYVVFLGASMGGPSAVKEFLDNLSPTLPIGILLAHHFNQSMLETLPRILNRHNDWRCQVIHSSQSLRLGCCLIAPLDHQVVCDSTGRIIVTNQMWSGDYKPAIGQLLKNASDVYGNELISIIFSGMGTDGSQHVADIQGNGSQLWAQDPSLSSCPEQPQAIIDSGYCQFIGSPKALALKLTAYINEKIL